MKSCNDENVERDGFLKCDGFVAIDKGTVTQKHCAENGSYVRGIRKQGP